MRVSKLGSCVVEDDGSGVWVRPARMTTVQMQAELKAAGIPAPESGKRKDYTAAVKVRTWGGGRVGQGRARGNGWGRGARGGRVRGAPCRLYSQGSATVAAAEAPFYAAAGCCCCCCCCAQAHRESLLKSIRDIQAHFEMSRKAEVRRAPLGGWGVRHRQRTCVRACVLAWQARTRAPPGRGRLRSDAGPAACTRCCSQAEALERKAGILMGEPAKAPKKGKVE